ncbi:MAG: hypothetical protein ACYTJ0_01025, partial [Planctomycetota bacterium]
IRSKAAARNARRPDPRESIEQARSHRHATGDAEAVASRLLDLSQRLAAQLDDKAERLEQLLADADDRLARLEGAVIDAPVGSVPAPGTPSPRVEPPSDPLTCSVYRLADAGRQPVEIARELDEQVGKVELILALRESA